MNRDGNALVAQAEQAVAVQNNRFAQGVSSAEQQQQRPNCCVHVPLSAPVGFAVRFTVGSSSSRFRWQRPVGVDIDPRVLNSIVCLSSPTWNE